MALLALLIFLMCVGNIACICCMDDKHEHNTTWFAVPTFLVTLLVGFASGLYVLIALAKASGLVPMEG